MARRLPSLNQLRAFEAAARHGSIKDGAEELCVTPAAVGHQIKALERALDTALFHRRPRRLELTADGRRLAREVGLALDRLEQAVAQASRRDPGGTLNISIAPFFGNRWLLPRLPGFHALHPGLEVKPSLSFDYVDLADGSFDAALRYGSGDWPGLEAVPIFRDCLRPVCAPQLAGDLRLPLSADEILALPRAFGRGWPGDWAAWAEAAGAESPEASRAAGYDSRAFMFDAALSGQAVILADGRMTAADEAAGRLVCLSPLAVERPQGIYLVSGARQADPRLALFADWLKAEAASSVR
ncbi:LysR substrate-binding domain-containing protein [Mangrovicoccus sp. HB161399]|uniref:LysR substrate-binding domain-containing protein n=1 Tax=Mangrovicoccus sp. HB161399 TaxID=2720392 RepID=UPI00155767EE|nr:LysR substrate-binding domain-containing protein [Mangrovicoccus sp. HB161399]